MMYGTRGICGVTYLANMAAEQSAQEQAKARRRALDCQSLTHGEIMNKDRFLRLWLCLILDGHHKMRAAAKLGAQVTVLCFGLQGVAVTCFDVPWEASTLTRRRSLRRSRGIHKM